MVNTTCKIHYACYIFLTVVECEALPVPDHAIITNGIPVRYVYSNITTYECVIGYELSGGDVERSCTETAVWSGIAPNCTSKYLQ